MTAELTDDRGVDPSPSAPDLGVLAEQLVAAALSSGVELTGPGGLLTGLIRQVLETALEVEMTEHLGYVGLWVGPGGGEGAKQWMTMLTALRNRGVLDVCIV